MNFVTLSFLFGGFALSSAYTYTYGVPNPITESGELRIGSFCMTPAEIEQHNAGGNTYQVEYRSCERGAACLNNKCLQLWTSPYASEYFSGTVYTKKRPAHVQPQRAGQIKILTGSSTGSGGFRILDDTEGALLSSQGSRAPRPDDYVVPQEFLRTAMKDEFMPQKELEFEQVRFPEEMQQITRQFRPIRLPQTPRENHIDPQYNARDWLVEKSRKDDPTLSNMVSNLDYSIYP